VLPYIILYFLPYGYLVNKAFLQMPWHIQIIGHISNITIFITPTLISITVYLAMISRANKLKIPSELGAKGRPQDINTVSAGISIKQCKMNPMVSEQQHNATNPTLNVADETLSSSDTSDIAVAHVEVIHIGDTEPTTLPVRCPASPRTPSAVARSSSLELEAATRAMKTNLLILLLTCLNYSVLAIPSANWKTLVALVAGTVWKCLLPTITTVSNFGPVRELVAVYLQRLVQPRAVSA
jgi:hypothetical protein